MIGTPIERALLVRRRSDMWLQAGVVFIHIPKAAGTSISQALYGRFLGHLRAVDVERWGSPTVRSLPRLAVTRNPWDRLVSAYRFVRRGSGVGPNAAGVWRAEQYRLPEFDTFEGFVREWLARRDPRKLDFVFQPQWPFVYDSHGRSLVQHVGRLEDLGSTYAFIKATVPAFSSIPTSNASGDAVQFRAFYTPVLADLVGSIYSEDVERFGYSFE